MPKSAVTISLVAEARGGPFVFWDDLDASVCKAQELGFDAVELFAPGPEAVSPDELQALLDATGLKLAAVGTGAGWVLHQLSLTSPRTRVREQAVEFISSMIDFGAQWDAPAIIGSMQGKWGGKIDRETALGFLGTHLIDLEEHAGQHGLPLIYEPLNRYETNLCNTLEEGVALIESRKLSNTKLLADLFHMNIEEVDIAASIRRHATHVDHIHFVDSNRRPAGGGHMDLEPIAAAISESGYDGYVSAEAFAWPDPESAARQTITEYSRLFS